MNKKASSFLAGNVLFIILNVIFLSIIIIFLVKQSSGAAVLEEIHSKQIALLIDSAKPNMILKIDMSKAEKTAESNNFDFANAVKITENNVYVKLRSDGGYNYGFFNDVSVSVYPDTDNKNEYNGVYVIVINEKEAENE